MTISSTLRKAGPFAGNGVVTLFPFAFKVFAKTDIELTRTDANGAVTTLALDSDYSVTLNANQDSTPGGTIAYPITGSPLPTGATLTGIGDLPYTQPTDITNNGGFYPSVIEDMADRSTIQIQQLAEIAARSIHFPVSETILNSELPAAAARAGNLLGFDASGSQVLLPIPASVGAGDLREDTFVAGVDFVAGTTKMLRLSRSYGALANINVHFDGAYQGPDQIATLVGQTLTFTSPIPVGVQKVFVKGGTTLSLNALAPNTLSVKVTDFGADPTGVLDSTAAFTEAKTFVEATGKAGVIEIPAGHYIVSGTIANDRSANAALPVVSWRGAGSDVAQITYSGNGILFDIIGNVASASFYGKLSGMTLLGRGLANTFAIGTTLCSFFRFSDLHIEGFDYAFYGQDIDHTLYDMLTLRFNKKAFFARINPTPGPNSTCPNQLTFLQCAISSNSDYGVDIEQGAANTFVGCQFEVNGAGNAHGWGVKINGSSLQGGPAVIMDGCYFESNNGDADLILTSVDANLNPPIADATYVINGTSFNRASEIYKATNSIVTSFGPVGTVGQQILVLNGCTFKGFNSYVPSPGTPYINYGGAQSRTKNNFFTTGCIFQSALEAPTTAQNPAKCYIEIGKAANQSVPNAVATVWAFDTVNIGFSWSSVPAVGAITIPEPGCYNIDVGLTFTGAVGGVCGALILKNGVPISAGEATASSIVSASCMKTFNAGDLISVSVTQNSGGAVTIANSGIANSYLTLTKMIDG